MIGRNCQHANLTTGSKAALYLSQLTQQTCWHIDCEQLYLCLNGTSLAKTPKEFKASLRGNFVRERFEFFGYHLVRFIDFPVEIERALTALAAELLHFKELSAIPEISD